MKRRTPAQLQRTLVVSTDPSPWLKARDYLIMVAVLILALLTAEAFHRHLLQEKRQPASRVVDAAQAVEDYHRALDAGAYRVAYGLLCAESRSRLSFRSFQEQQPESGDVVILEAEAIDDHTALVTVERRRSQSWEQTRWVAVYNGQSWRLRTSLRNRPV